MSAPEPVAPVREGDMIASKYRVERILGAGGMGVVVLALHVDLEQRVAIKFLLPEAASDGELVERFLREGRASVRLRGQHVVKTIDVGRLEDGAPFLVMEFLQGKPLRDHVEQHPNGMPIETLASFLLQACEGVAEAHSLGIVHRDLKPENLFVTHGVDGWPLLKVLDFGISKIADEGFAGALTRTNSLFGSPMYMSPEQMRSAKHVDPRADIWSLGVIGYELVCGRPPFDADTMYDLCLKVAQDTPQSLLERRPDVPPDLAEGILRCLHKEVGKRTQNVADLAAVLEPHAGPRARGTAARLRDVIRASGAAFAVLADPESSVNNVQSAWGATERMSAPPRRRLVPLAVAALVGAGVVAVAALRTPPASVPQAALPTTETLASPVPMPAQAALPAHPAASVSPAWDAIAPDAGASGVAASLAVPSRGTKKSVPGSGAAPAAGAPASPPASPAPATPAPAAPPPVPAPRNPALPDGFTNER